MPSNANRLQLLPFDVDSNVESGLSFDSTTVWGKFVGYDSTGTKQEFYFLLGDGDPNGDTNHDAVTHGFYYDYTNLKIYIKTSAAAWTLVASNT